MYEVTTVEEALQAFSVCPPRGHITISRSEQVQCSCGRSVEELGVLTSGQRKLKIRYQETSSENIAEE
jgi:hypothetical protein